MIWLFASMALLGAIPTVLAADPDGLFGITANTDMRASFTCKLTERNLYYDCEVPAAAPLFSRAVINYEAGNGVCGITLSVDLDKEPAKTRLEEITRLLDETFGRDKAVRSSLSRLLSERPRDWWQRVGVLVEYDAADNAWRIEENAKLRKLWEASLQVTRKPADKIRIELHAYFHPQRYCPSLPTQYTIKQLKPAVPK